MHNIGTKLKLHSSQDIVSAFESIISELAKMVRELTPLPKPFVPKFEEDDQRFDRLEAIENAKAIRAKEAQKHLPSLWAKHEGLARMMKEHIRAKRNGAAE